jgi:hypothetical protein
MKVGKKITQAIINMTMHKSINNSLQAHFWHYSKGKHRFADSASSKETNIAVHILDDTENEMP